MGSLTVKRTFECETSEAIVEGIAGPLASSSWCLWGLP